MDWIGIEEKFAEYAVSLEYDDIPGEVIDTVKHLFLDFVGLCYRGASVDSSEPVIKFLKELNAISSKDSATGGGVLAGTNFAARPEYSCLANGCFSHSLELDDVVNEASIHPGVVVFPIALSVGEVVGASGKDFITASVVGYEIMIRIGKAVNPTEHYKHGFHPTGTCGTFAAAAVAARLFGLKKDELISAFGIAASQTASSLEFLTDGAWTKRFHPGWSAHSGYVAAILAASGFKGPTRGIEGKYGFLNSYSDAPVPELATKDLGGSYLTLNTSIKPHACCRYNQSPIDAILHVVNENKINTNQVHKVDVKLVGPGVQLVGEPIKTKQNPKNIVDAQFSLPYACAIAIIKRRAFLDDYREEMIFSDEVKELMKKVNCTRDSRLEKDFPKKWPCEVTITTIDGCEFEKSIDYPKGDPQNPLSEKELISKFKSLTENMEQKQRERLINEVKLLENVRNINHLARYLTKN